MEEKYVMKSIDPRNLLIGVVEILEHLKIPYMIVLGDKEQESGTLSIRAGGSQSDMYSMTHEQLLEKLALEIQDKRLTSN